MDSEDLLAFLGAVGHAQRRRVIAELADGRLYVSELHRHALPGRRRDLLLAGHRHDHRRAGRVARWCWKTPPGRPSVSPTTRASLRGDPEALTLSPRDWEDS
ncbi:hypothetical protein [Saccharopolyspora sp. ASAGF58]|uniref:hypothetical protein n=1 Tax=Saccharopolyspora sp. ASAGF58 TaxID=2719023 RepID=UPI001B3078D4|nr:hypothetical protein [Saccharopolyspora sp. ASAGF58]